MEFSKVAVVLAVIWMCYKSDLYLWLQNGFCKHKADEIYWLRRQIEQHTEDVKELERQLTQERRYKEQMSRHLTESWRGLQSCENNVKDLQNEMEEARRKKDDEEEYKHSILLQFVAIISKIHSSIKTLNVNVSHEDAGCNMERFDFKLITLLDYNSTKYEDVLNSKVYTAFDEVANCIQNEIDNVKNNPVVRVYHGQGLELALQKDEEIHDCACPKGSAEPPDTGPIVGESIGFTLVVLLIVATIILVVYCFWGPQIYLFIKLKTGMRLRKRDKKFSYDMTLYYADDPTAERFATAIQNELTVRGYRIYGPRDFKAGQARLSEPLAAISKGAVLGFVYSDQVTDDHLSQCILEGAGVEMGYHNILMIDCRSDNTDNQPVVRWERTVERIRNGEFDSAVQLLNLDDSDNEGRADDEILLRPHRPSRVSSPDYLLNLVKTVKWPGEQDGARIRENFWCKLQMFLPQPEGKNH